MNKLALIPVEEHPLDGSQESLFIETTTVTAQQKVYKVQQTDTLAGILIKFNIKFQDLKKWNGIHTEHDIHCKSGMLIVSQQEDNLEFQHRKSIDSTGSRKSHDSGCFIEPMWERVLEPVLEVRLEVILNESKPDLMLNEMSTKSSDDRIERFDDTTTVPLELIDYEAREAWSWN
jgi:hypothetical protein